MVKVRTGPNCASIGLAQEALVGVTNSKICPGASFSAQARMAGVSFADRLSKMT